MTLLRECLVAAIEMCGDEVQLAWWWCRHEDVLSRLGEDDWQAVWDAKEDMRAEWEAAARRREMEDRRRPKSSFFD